MIYLGSQFAKNAARPNKTKRRLCYQYPLILITIRHLQTKSIKKQSLLCNVAIFLSFFLFKQSWMVSALNVKLKAEIENGFYACTNKEEKCYPKRKEKNKALTHLYTIDSLWEIVCTPERIAAAEGQQWFHLPERNISATHRFPETFNTQLFNACSDNKLHRFAIVLTVFRYDDLLLFFFYLFFTDKYASGDDSTQGQERTVGERNVPIGRGRLERFTSMPVKQSENARMWMNLCHARLPRTSSKEYFASSV